MQQVSVILQIVSKLPGPICFTTCPFFTRKDCCFYLPLFCSLKIKKAKKEKLYIYIIFPVVIWRVIRSKTWSHHIIVLMADGGTLKTKSPGHMESMADCPLGLVYMCLINPSAIGMTRLLCKQLIHFVNPIKERQHSHTLSSYLLIS